MGTIIIFRDHDILIVLVSVPVVYLYIIAAVRDKNSA